MAPDLDVSSEQIQELRSIFLKELEAKGESAIHPADLERVKGSDSWLRRFLLHHDLNQKEALKMLWETVEWRKEFQTNEINENNIKMEYIVEGSVFAHGRDKDGCALFIFNCKKHTRGSKDFKEFQRCVVYWFERLEREENGKQITIFFDMDQCGLSNMDMEFIRYIIGLFKHYYPYFLNYILIFEMAWILNAAFKVIKTWLPEKAIEIIKFLKKNNIHEYVPLDQALKSWGGNDDYVFSFVPEIQETTTNSNGLPTNASNRKVHFADGSPMSDTSGSTGDKEQNGGVLSVFPPGVITFVKEGNDLVSTLELQNTDPNINISYKMKTTSPEKFRVRPSAGCLPPGGRATISVTLLPGFALGGLSRDKFLVMSRPVDFVDFSPQELTELWKNTSSKDISQHRLRCAQNSEVVKNGNAVAVGGNSAAETDHNQLSQLSANVSQLVENQKHLQVTVANLRMQLWVTIGLVIFLGMFLFYVIHTETKKSLEHSCYVKDPALAP